MTLTLSLPSDGLLEKRIVKIKNVGIIHKIHVFFCSNDSCANFINARNKVKSKDLFVPHDIGPYV